MGTRSTQAVLDGYFSRYNGIEHGEHSVSEEAYEGWVRSRLRQLTREGGVDDGDAEAIVDALRGLDEGQMVPYPEAAATLRRAARRRAHASACAPTGAGSSMPS